MLKFLFLVGPLMAQINFKDMKEVKANCGPVATPGKECILHCVTATNQSASLFNCNFEGKGFFKERDSYNSLMASDMRSVVIYPLQKTEVCFNFGKTTTNFWELSKWEILNPNNSCQEVITDYRLYIAPLLRKNF